MFLISLIIIIIGTVGALIPLIPGIPIALLGLIIYALVTGFSHVSFLGIVVFSILTALTVVVDIFGPALGAKKYQSSPAGTWGAILGAVFGISILGPIGVLIGPFLGAFCGEWLSVGSEEQALKTAWGAFLGQMLGWAFKVSVGVAMILYLILSLFK